MNIVKAFSMRPLLVLATGIGSDINVSPHTKKRRSPVYANAGRAAESASDRASGEQQVFSSTSTGVINSCYTDRTNRAL